MVICKNKKCSIGECDQAETCTAYAPIITNADCVRSMHDLDLALFLHKMLGMDVPMALRWLQSPVAEDTE